MFYNITRFNNPICIARHYSFHLLLTTNLKERTTVLHSFSLLCELSEKNECLTFSKIYSLPPRRLPSSVPPLSSSFLCLRHLFPSHSLLQTLSLSQSSPSTLPILSLPESRTPSSYTLPCLVLPFAFATSSLHTLYSNTILPSIFSTPPSHTVPSRKQNPLQLHPPLSRSSLCLLHLLPKPLRPFPTILFTSKPTSFFTSKPSFFSPRPTYFKWQNYLLTRWGHPEWGSTWRTNQWSTKRCTISMSPRRICTRGRQNSTEEWKMCAESFNFRWSHPITLIL